MRFLKAILHLSKRLLINTIKVLTLFHIFLFIAVFIYLMYISKYNPETSSLMLYRKFFFKHKIKPVNFIPIKDIPIDVQKMVVAVEDYRFYTHPGIDIQAIKFAYAVNKKVGYKLYGGSTITQQLTRTLMLFPDKYFIRKYFEILIALEMDLFLPKERILELYLNHCEWGKGIFGIGQASPYYFKKPINKLSIDQTTRLITILANPIGYNPYNFIKNKFFANRYFSIKFRYYTFLKFHNK